ncbi:MAG: hypothetical protein LBP91_04075 [Coriobacteriales bacterium]|jgi:hypothetical protein|nr:hypothetical protein [Coriobacteriales bacterium]
MARQKNAILKLVACSALAMVVLCLALPVPAYPESFENSAEPASAALDEMLQTSTFTPQVDLLTKPYVDLPLGGNALPPELTGELVVMQAGSENSGYFATYSIGTTTASRTAALSAALLDLYNTNDPSANYVMYVGSDMLNMTAEPFADSGAAGTFSGLRGKIDTLVLTGSAIDDTTRSPATAPPGAVRQFSTSSTDSSFGCNLVVRNISHRLGGTNVYMNGYGLVLGGNSWQTAATAYYGGSAAGSVTPVANSASITVYSTGVGNTLLYGGMKTGTLNGNTEITVFNSSGNQVQLFGGGEGLSATATAQVTGNVTNTILGMATNAGGLDRFLGGVHYGDIGGRITNTISGPGRFTTNGTSSDGSAVNAGNYVGGSRYGSIAGAGTAHAPLDTAGLQDDCSPLVICEDYAIKNNVDSSAYTNGRMYFIGANTLSGTVSGNIINLIKAGGPTSGGFSGVEAAGGYGTVSFGSWQNTFTAAGSGAIGNVPAGIAAAKSSFAFQVYGSIVTVVRSGCISTSTDRGYFRGAGYGGYIEGDCYSALGTEGVAYKDNYSAFSYFTNPGPDRTANDEGYQSGFDLVGHGGLESVASSICVVGNTTLYTKLVRARWTYGGGFGGVHIGNSLRQIDGGTYDTVEGTGYDLYLHKGDGRVEVRGGQIDGFLGGGGWNDHFQDGDVSVEVFDALDVNHPVVCNASLGGTYGYEYNRAISGNSAIVIHGGDFSGTANNRTAFPANGFSAGPSYSGAIYGNASMTIDLRDNRNGFKVASSDYISGGRRLGAGAGAILGTNADNTIVLNIFTDDEGSDLLSGLNIYGDAATGNTTNTKAEHITINVNAPGSSIGNLFATNYSNLTGSGATTRIWRDVTVDLVSAKTVKGLSPGNGSENITNAVAAQSAANGRHAVINVGPQSEDPTHFLGEWDTRVPTNGLPRIINVGATGINGFTEMTVTRRLLNATAGTIKNGGPAATLANHGTSYHLTGQVTLRAGEGVDASGLGVVSTSSGIVIIGKLVVEGAGTAYIQSPGSPNQIMLTDVSVQDSLTWIKTSKTAASPLTAASSWFGSSSGWQVFTLNPTKANAEKVTPFILEGREVATGQVLAGDNVIPATGSEAYAVCFPASIYRWQVAEGAGQVSHDVAAYTAAARPTVGTVKAVGTVAKDTPSSGGKLIVAAFKVPEEVNYPCFSFIPDETRGEWVKEVQVHRLVEPFTAPEVQEGFTTIGEQPYADYILGVAERTLSWTAFGTDRFYAFDIAARFTNEAELSAKNVIITEAEAAAIAGADEVIGYTQAMGRPFFVDTLNDSYLEALALPLGENQFSRTHTIVYGSGLPENKKQLLVSVIVVRDETVLSPDRSFALYANDAVLKISDARALADQADLDSNHTRATVIRSDGTAADALLGGQAFAAITSTTKSELPKSVPVVYTYAPDEYSGSVTKEVTVAIIKDDTINITVGKKVTGALANEREAFVFTVYLCHSNGESLPQGEVIAYTGNSPGNTGAPAPDDGELTLDKDGAATFSLKHGQSITLLEIPAKVQIRIVETPSGNYIPSFTDTGGTGNTGNDTGFLTAGVGDELERSFTFTNARTLLPIFIGITDESWPLLVLLAAALLALLSLRAVRLRKKKGADAVSQKEEEC